MKKFILLITLILFASTSVYAANFPPSKMKKISSKKLPVYNTVTNQWMSVKAKKAENTYETGCDFNFLINGRLIGYSNSKMKFYEYSYDNGNVVGTELPLEEIQKLYPSYKFIKLSEFSEHTNSLKIKKHIKNLRLGLINDGDQSFENYKLTSGNTKFKTYDMTGFADIKKKGMIHFSSVNEDADGLPWYVILVR